MRVAMVAAGGDARRVIPRSAAAQLALWLSRVKKGWEVELLVPPPVKGRWRGLPGVRVVEVGALRVRGLYLASYAISLSRLLGRYDAVVFYSVAVALSLLKPRIGLRTRLVLYEWEPWWLLQVYHRRWPPRVAYLVRRIGFLVARRADALIVVHPRMLTTLSPSDDGIPDVLLEKPLLILPQGVEPEVIGARPPREEVEGAWEEMGGGDPLLAFVGMLHPLAVPWEPVILLKRLLDAGVRGARLAYVGDGEAAGIVRRVAEKLGVEDRVAMLGFKPPERVQAYIHAADLLLSPAAPGYYERTGILPTKLLYYMALGKAAVAAPWILVPDHVVIKSRFDEPSDALLEAAVSEETRRRVGEAALEYVKSRHSYDKLAERLAAFLGRLVEA